MTRRKIMSILWFPASVAILVPVIIELAAAGRVREKKIAPAYVRGSGDGGPGIFFLVLPLLLTGAITAIVLLRRPTWGIGRRTAMVVGVGLVATVTVWLLAVGLDVLPAKPLVLAYAFLLTQLVSAPSLA